MAFTRKLAIRAASILLSAALVWFLYLNLPTQATRVLAFRDWGKFSKKSEAASEAQRKLIENSNPCTSTHGPGTTIMATVSESTSGWTSHLGLVLCSLGMVVWVSMTSTTGRSRKREAELSWSSDFRMTKKVFRALLLS